MWVDTGPFPGDVFDLPPFKEFPVRATIKGPASCGAFYLNDGHGFALQGGHHLDLKHGHPLKFFPDCILQPSSACGNSDVIIHQTLVQHFNFKIRFQKLSNNLFRSGRVSNKLLLSQLYHYLSPGTPRFNISQCLINLFQWKHFIHNRF